MAINAALQYPLATLASLKLPASADTFLKLPHAILSATRFVSLNTGELLPLSANDKIIFLHMKGRHDYFKTQGGEYFDSQQSIADACGVSVATVKRTIQALRDHGYLTVKASMGSNRYTFVADLKVGIAEESPVPPVAANDARIFLGDVDEPDFRIHECGGEHFDPMIDGPPEWCIEDVPDRA